MTTTICAPATAPGGAIAIIRLSGPEAITIAARIFHPASGKPLTEAKPQSIHFGQIKEPPVAASLSPSGRDCYAVLSGNVAEPIDEALASVFRAPHSFTGEDSVELSCHASPYILNKVMELLIANGARLAQPGEFTKRAFLNGKMDLSQAEAVADLIASKNAATHRMAMSQLRGNFSSELSNLRDKLLELTSLMELELDFSDHEELEFADRAQLVELSQTINGKIEQLRQSFKTGQALKLGIPVAIVGKTNVGKSTLLNRLLHEDKAIVSDIHGTTRDVIEDTINIRGIDFRFIDTAGIRDTTDEIERLGIERTKQKMREATIILHLADTLEDFQQERPVAASLSPSGRDCSAILGDPFAEPEHKILRVLTKIDQQRPVLGEPTVGGRSESLSFAEQSLIACTGNCPQSHADILLISAKENINIDLLEDALIKAANLPEIRENDVIVTSLRHYEALTAAHAALQRVLAGLQAKIPTDLLAEDLRQVLSHLAEITGGTITTDEVLGNIFKNFCVGK